MKKKHQKNSRHRAGLGRKRKAKAGQMPKRQRAAVVHTPPGYAGAGLVMASVLGGMAMRAAKDERN